MRLLGFERTATSPVVRTVRGRLKDFDQWLGSLQFDDLLHWLSHRWKPITAGTFLIAAVCYAASGLMVIGPNEVGVVERFGRAATDLPPGLHVRWPAPVETVVKVRPAEVRTIEIGFRSATGDALTWASPHSGIQRLADESVMVTGDGNLVEVSATLRYRVSDPRAFLFSHSGSERHCSGRRPNRPFANRWRAAFPRATHFEAHRLFRKTRPTGCNRSSSKQLQGGLGIEVAGLTVHDLHPPAEVVSAYHDVARAIQARDQQINRAEAQATLLRTQAEEEALPRSR